MCHCTARFRLWLNSRGTGEGQVCVRAQVGLIQTHHGLDAGFCGLYASVATRTSGCNTEGATLYVLSAPNLARSEFTNSVADSIAVEP
jgi:hypothetical protein